MDVLVISHFKCFTSILGASHCPRRGVTTVGQLVWLVMKVVISLKRVAALSLLSWSFPAVSLNCFILACRKLLTTTQQLLLHSLGTLTCGWHSPDVNVRDQAPHCHPGCSRLIPNCSDRDLAHIELHHKSCPTALAPRRTSSSSLVPISSSLAATLASLDLLTGVFLVHSNVAALMLKQRHRTCRPVRKARQITCFAFPSPCLLKFVLHLISSARLFEIITVSFLLLFIYPNLSHFFFCKQCPFSFTSFTSFLFQMGKALFLQGRGVQALSVTTLNNHWPVLQNLSCCQQLKLFSSSLVKVITWRSNCNFSLWKEDAICFWPQE